MQTDQQSDLIKSSRSDWLLSLLPGTYTWLPSNPDSGSVVQNPRLTLCIPKPGLVAPSCLQPTILLCLLRRYLHLNKTTLCAKPPCVVVTSATPLMRALLEPPWAPLATQTHVNPGPQHPQQNRLRRQRRTFKAAVIPSHTSLRTRCNSTKSCMDATGRNKGCVSPRFIPNCRLMCRMNCNTAATSVLLSRGVRETTPIQENCAKFVPCWTPPVPLSQFRFHGLGVAVMLKHWSKPWCGKHFDNVWWDLFKCHVSF